MDSPADRLRRARIARGYATASDAARAFGWPVPTYTHHENGTRRLSPAAAERYGKAYGVSAAYLLGLAADSTVVTVIGVTVVGDAAIGVWRDSDIDKTPQQMQRMLAVPATGRHGGQGDMRFAVRIADAGVDKLIGVGEFAICEPYQEGAALPQDGLVYCERQRDGLVERSIRRVRTNGDGSVALSGHSHDPAFNTTIRYPSRTSEQVRILGVVVARYGDIS